jgi:hypothetical protein
LENGIGGVFANSQDVEFLSAHRPLCRVTEERENAKQVRGVSASDNYGRKKRLVNRIQLMAFWRIDGSAERISSAALGGESCRSFCEVLSFIYP